MKGCFHILATETRRSAKADACLQQFYHVPRSPPFAHNWSCLYHPQQMPLLFPGEIPLGPVYQTTHHRAHAGPPAVAVMWDLGCSPIAAEFQLSFPVSCEDNVYQRHRF